MDSNLFIFKKIIFFAIFFSQSARQSRAYFRIVTNWVFSHDRFLITWTSPVSKFRFWRFENLQIHHFQVLELQKKQTYYSWYVINSPFKKAFSETSWKGNIFNNLDMQIQQTHKTISTSFKFTYSQHWSM